MSVSVWVILYKKCSRLQIFTLRKKPNRHDDPTAWAESFVIAVSKARPVLDGKDGWPPLVVVLFVSWMDYWTGVSFIAPEEQSLCMFLLTFVVGKWIKWPQGDIKQLQTNYKGTQNNFKKTQETQRNAVQLRKTTVWLQIDLKRQQKETQINGTHNSHKVTTKRCKPTTKRHKTATNQLQRDATQL